MDVAIKTIFDPLFPAPGDRATYDAIQVDYVLNAYRQVFPKITPDLAEYWSLSRQRKWAVLTTDFHNASFDRLADLDAAVERIDRDEKDAGKKGEALRQACLRHQVGFRMGLSPWTDHLLLETYTEAKDTATILLGHDWYPIVVKNRARSDSPLWSTDALRYVERYWPAAPQSVFDAATVCFFFNLYPDYRPGWIGDTCRRRQRARFAPLGRSARTRYSWNVTTKSSTLPGNPCDRFAMRGKPS